MTDLKFTCSGKTSDGSACEDDGDCFSAHCESYFGPEFDLFGSALRGICGLELPAASSCASSRQCASRRCEDHKCEPRLIDGESCDSRDDCVSGACTEALYFGKCGESKRNDDVCLSGSSCASGRCDLTCKGLLADGSVCNEDSDC